MLTNGTLCGSQGDLLSWNKMKWDIIGNVKISNISMDEICAKPKSIFVFNHPFYSLKSCTKQCMKFQRSPVLSYGGLNDTKLIMNEMSQIINDINGNKQTTYPSSATWVAVTDQENEGVWRNSKTGGI